MSNNISVVFNNEGNVMYYIDSIDRPDEQFYSYFKEFVNRLPLPLQGKIDIVSEYEEEQPIRGTDPKNAQDYIDFCYIDRKWSDENS